MKKILLTGLISLCSISVANAICIAPTTLKCNCAHPIINLEGKLACGTSYCGDKKCMPDGSCCSVANFCQVGNDKYCCSENQTCDTVSGCIEAKANIETLCANARGTIVTASSGTFCMSNETMDWYAAEAWCQNNGMTMPTMKEICLTWDGSSGGNSCPGVNEASSEAEIWSATVSDDYDGIELAFGVRLFSGFVLNNPRESTFHAFCH